MFLEKYKLNYSIILRCGFLLSVTNILYCRHNIPGRLKKKGNVLNNITLTLKHQFQSRTFEDIKGKGNDIILESSQLS